MTSNKQHKVKDTDEGRVRWIGKPKRISCGFLKKKKKKKMKNAKKD